MSRQSRRAVPVLAGTLVAAAAILATMSWSEPPRFDGAGYATLGRSLAMGRGYREIHLPAAPRHAHFPPAYPGVLAAIWTLAGTDDRVEFTRLAHGMSILGIVGGVWGLGRWWATTEPRGVATCLTLALAANWIWARAGGVIRSEPLAIALGSLVLLAARRRPAWLGPGVLLGLGVLTRQVFACWAIAVAVDLGLRRGRAAAAKLIATALLVVSPWVAWQASVGSGTQSGLFRVADLPRVAASQALFYLRRLPDAIAGPFVEYATVFGRVGWVGTMATLAAAALSGLIAVGWWRLARSPRRRLGGLIPLATLPLLLIWPFTEAGRFLVPLVPFALMGAVEGAGLVLRRARVRRPRLWAARLVLAAALPYPAYAAIAQRAAAERQTQHGFDAACAWVAARPTPEGAVMARHPADAAWLTGRLAAPIPEEGPERVAAAIRRDRVAFLIVDDDRYARSPDNPLRPFILGPGPVRKVWGDGGLTAVYQVLPDPVP